jgi:hypothetical protein
MNVRTKRSLEEVKQYYLEKRRQEAAEVIVATKDREIRIPTQAPKRHQKMGPITKNGTGSYGAQTLRTCPGGQRGLAGIIRMIEATETGCRLATKSELQRLQASGRNANTTQGSYHGAILH